MSETFNFDFFQIPSVGVQQPELASQTRTDANVIIRRSSDMKLSNFGAGNVGGRMTSDYTRTLLSFKSKDELSDINVITADGGIDSRDTTVNYNPLVAGSTVKYTRDDQFIRMIMSKDNGAQIEPPKFDVMDSKESTAEGIAAATYSTIKNWPAEGWRTFGGKYDFLPYTG